MTNKGSAEMQINEQIAAKVLETVRHGLVSGLGIQEPGKMCVEAAVCYALGMPHGDEPTCVSPSVRRFKIVMNDSLWSSPAARSKGLERLALAQLGSNKDFDNIEFARRVAAAAGRWSAAAAAAAVYDKVLSDCAEDVVQILIAMNAPGCKWLYLTEVKQ